MKIKLIAVIACIVIVAAFVCSLAACKPTHDSELTFYVPDGAPALAVASLFENNKLAGKRLNLTITTGANVQAKVLNGEADIVVCPTNMAAMLYNKGVDYKLVSANVFGLLYLVGNKPAASLNELIGKVVHSIGKNNTPEFVFKKILDSANIEYIDSDVAVEGKVAIRYYNAGGEIVPHLKSGNIDYAILGEPTVTKSGVPELFDLQALWKQAANLDESYPQAGVFVKSALLADTKLIDGLLEALNGNAQYLQDNSGKIASLLVENGSNDFNGTTFTADALARCNIRCVKATDCKAQLTAYFNAITTINTGFKLPDDGFYGK